MASIKDVPEVEKAFREVQKFFPKVNTVLFLGDGTWRYFDTEGEMPVFPDELDVGPLEDANDAVDNRYCLPIAFGDPDVPYDY